MKKVLILGAGIYQVPLIKKANEMGLFTIVCSIPGKYPGFALADKVYYEDVTNYEAILQIAKNETIDGIITAGSDVPVPSIGFVCDKLNLKGLSFEAANIASNKMLMKEKYEKCGVRTARYRQVPFDLSIIKEKTKQLKFPLIFKAVDTSGSRGIIKVKALNEFENAMNFTKSATKLDYFIVEEFLEGQEFGAQAFVQDGKIEFILPHGDYVFVGNTGVPIGHYVPYEINNEAMDDIKEQLKNAIKAMELDNCAINADFILVNGQAYVLEIGGRVGATCLAEMTSIYYGFDYYEKLLQVCLGYNTSFNGTEQVPNACMLLKSDISGMITSQNNNNINNPNIVDVQFDFDIGDRVEKFSIGPHRIGHVITKGNTLQEAVTLLKEALEKIYIEVK